MKKNTREMNKFGLIILLAVVITQNVSHAQECSLPNNNQSECIRLHYCDSFAKIIRDSRGNPSQSERAYMQNHACARNGFVCCPDNAVAATTTVKTTTTTTTTTLSSIPRPSSIQGGLGTSNPVLPLRNDLTAVKSHRNINLLNQKKCGTSSSNRIVGGFKAAPGEFPWMALLQYRNRLDAGLSFNCGGSLISPSYVLTAAHCINRDLVGVRLGEHDLSTDLDCDSQDSCQDPVQDIRIEKAIKHNQYDSKKKLNDIALLRLASPADTDKRNVKTICLPTDPVNQLEKLDTAVLDKLTISGWGRVESGKASDVLLKAHVPYVDTQNCGDKFRTLSVPIYDTFLCAGGKNKTDTCNGDSGGPIQGYGEVDGKFGKVIQFGVVSGGVACDNPNVIYPGIYTNLAYYLTWILDNMDYP